MTLVDCNSKFGTEHNDVKLPPGGQVTVVQSDRLKFGQGPLTGDFR